MKYSDKKKVEEFFMKVMHKIEENMHSYNHVGTVVHNAKIELVEFLDKE